jgi:carboxymethylenebutenolidase
MKGPMERHEIARAEFVATGEGKRAYLAVPAGGGPFPGVLLFQEAFGVNDYIQSEARRLAEHGYAAIAPDLFDGDTYTYAELDKVVPRLQSLGSDALLEHALAAAAYFDADAGVRHRRYGCVGFCMGGRLAVLTALALGTKIGAAASFYGGGIAPKEPRMYAPLIGRLRELQSELLLIYGADDQGIAPDEHGRIAETLSREKKRYTISVYAGAPHGFASRDRDSYRPQQAEAAWLETLALLERTLR